MEGATTALTAVGTVFSNFGEWVGDLVGVIADSPLLLIPVGIMCFGATIGLAKRLIGR